MPIDARLFAFDLDDTLAPSKAPLPGPVASVLARLLDRAAVAIISGGQIAQFRQQVIARLADASPDGLSRLHLMPVTGTQYWRYDDGEWALRYEDGLTAEEKTAALAAVETTAKEFGYWESETWGPILEDRGSQITFSALGQQAPVEAKKAWDPTGEKKNRLAAAVQLQLPELSVRSGGSTSIDITRKGVDKGYAMEKLAAASGIPVADMIFVGDRLDPEGNDYPVVRTGVRTHAVTGWEDTVAYLEAQLAD
ncbi:HAD-IIB family hydrolase [Gryllotalpicola ginsengisoli]|uniref:HAD-IIB family hydrolase n=1 Tax=Gryllotalpicola ginsengisoli TaxID=444608 RepID=UPI0003B53B48|nr:HAD-IIB family hydrolase [Gryllotalpicola ginsengisoli]